MRKATRFLLCLMTAFTYVLGYMGFGIHTCHEDGSRHLVWLCGDVSCEAIHHHSHESDHDHHHDGHCCSTQVFVVTDAQDSAPGVDRIAAPEITLPLLAVAEAFLPVISEYVRIDDVDTPPLISPPTLSLLSVWLV